MFTRESHLIARTFLLVALSLCLMVFDWRTGAENQVRSILSVPLAGIQHLVTWPVSGLRGAADFFRTWHQLLAENGNLKAEQLLLRAKVQRLDGVESENRSLNALLHSSATVQGRVLVAHLLAIDRDPFIRQLTLNRGQHDGLFRGQPVLDAFGLAGQVMAVNPFTSEVLLVNDPRSGVPVQVVRNGVRAIAVGDPATGGLHLVNVPQTADILPGDQLVTSGLGQNFPEGYPVGRVTDVIRNPGLQFATIPVRPAARLDRGRQVLLVWPDHPVAVTRDLATALPAALFSSAVAMPATVGSESKKTADNRQHRQEQSVSQAKKAAGYTVWHRKKNPSEKSLTQQAGMLKVKKITKILASVDHSFRSRKNGQIGQIRLETTSRSRKQLPVFSPWKMKGQQILEKGHFDTVLLPAGWPGAAV